MSPTSYQLLHPAIVLCINILKSVTEGNRVRLDYFNQRCSLYQAMVCRMPSSREML